MGSTHGADVPTPSSVRRAGALVAVQGAALVVVAVVLVVRALTGADEAGPSLGYGLAAWFAVAGAALLAAGSALLRGRRGGRGPATAAQVLLLPVAYYLLTSGQLVWGLAVGALAALTLSQLYARASAEWMDAQYAPLPEDEGPPASPRRAPRAPRR